MVRLACVDVLKLPLQLLLKRKPEWANHPAALVDRDSPHGTVLSANRRARKAGILPGLRYASALSLASDLRAGTVSPRELDDCIGTLSEALRGLSPGVEIRGEEPGVFWLNAGGLVPLYPSLGQWRRDIGEVLSALSFHARVAVGFTRFGTYASAKTLPRIFPSRKKEVEAALAAPLAVLPFTPKVLERLGRLGLGTVGSFLRLSAGSIRKRFGSAAEGLYHFASGELTVPLQPVEFEEELGCGRRLTTAETDSRRLLLQLESCLEILLTGISRRQLLVTELRLSLILEDAAPRVEALRPAAPCCNRSLLLELLALRLEHPRSGDGGLASGVISFHLSVSCVKGSPAQLELFQRPRRDLAAGARAFARIRAVFGNAAVQTPVLEKEHFPERGFSWKNAEKPLTAKEVRMPGGALRLVRRFYREPRPLRSSDHGRPDIRAPNSPFPGCRCSASRASEFRGAPDGRLSGPYRISGRWWEAEIDRDYFYVESPEGRLLWIYRDRPAGRWMLCGAVE